MSKRPKDTFNIHLAKGILLQLADTFGIAADPKDIDSMRSAMNTFKEELPESLRKELSSLVEDLFAPQKRTPAEDKNLMERALNLAEQNELWHCKTLGDGIGQMEADIAQSQVMNMPSPKKTLH